MLTRFAFSILIALIPMISQATVIESNRYADVLAYMNAETLLVTDLDNTVIRPIQTIGSDQWGVHIMNKLRAAGVEEHLVVDAGVAMFSAVQMKSQVKLVESSTADVLKQARSKGAQILGLTARPLYLSERTLDQLQSVGFPKALPESFEVARGAKYVNGIVFVGESNKGEILKQVLKDRAQYKHVRRVVFIDDKPRHAQNVDKALLDSSYEVISIRYGAADAWVQSYDQKKADEEWKTFIESDICHITKTCPKSI